MSVIVVVVVVIFPLVLFGDVVTLKCVKEQMCLLIRPAPESQEVKCEFLYALCTGEKKTDLAQEKNKLK